MEIGDKAINKPRHLDRNFKPAAPIPPNKDGFSTSISRKITRDEFIRLMNIDESIVVFGQFNYTDSYSGKYETGFCFLSSNDGSRGLLPNR